MKFKSTHFALKASDFDKTLEFYKNVLDAKPTRIWGEEDNRICLTTLSDGTSLEIFAGGEKPAASHATNINTSGIFMHLAVATDDTEKAFKNAIKFGAKERIAPREIIIPSTPPYPVKIAFVFGPDGEEIEFFQEI